MLEINVNITDCCGSNEYKQNHFHFDADSKNEFDKNMHCKLFYSVSMDEISLVIVRYQ